VKIARHVSWAFRVIITPFANTPRTTSLLDHGANPSCSRYPLAEFKAICASIRKCILWIEHDQLEPILNRTFPQVSSRFLHCLERVGVSLHGPSPQQISTLTKLGLMPKRP
jgi:hypothetical protein